MTSSRSCSPGRSRTGSRTTRDRSSLQTPCDRAEVENLIGRRLKHLFEIEPCPVHEAEPTFPLPDELVRKLVGLRARDVLLECHLYRERCIEEGKMADYPIEGDGERGEARSSSEKAINEIEQAWNDFRVGFAPIIPSDEADLAVILSQAIKDCSDELPPGHSYGAKAEGRFVLIEPEETTDGGTSIPRGHLQQIPQRWMAGRSRSKSCSNKPAKRRQSPWRSVRWLFPATPRQPSANCSSELVEGGGRCVVVEDSDWRTMVALARFKDQRGSAQALDEWQKQTRPLSNLRSLREILQLEALHGKARQPLSS